MLDLLILIIAILITAWASWPPRGEHARWLASGLVAFWAALVLVGWRRGILPGFEPWLILLALIGALVALLVIWSAANLIARPRQRASSTTTDSKE
jgi:F0F1-type ATP synthase assembly protein I